MLENAKNWVKRQAHNVGQFIYRNGRKAALGAACVGASVGVPTIAHAQTVTLPDTGVDMVEYITVFGEALGEPVSKAVLLGMAIFLIYFTYRMFKRFAR